MQITLSEAAIIAIYRRMLELGKTPRKELKENAERIIKKYKLSEEEIRQKLKQERDVIGVFPGGV